MVTGHIGKCVLVVCIMLVATLAGCAPALPGTPRAATTPITGGPLAKPVTMTPEPPAGPSAVPPANGSQQAQPHVSPSAAAPAGGGPPHESSLETRARADLAARLGLGYDDVEVVSVDKVEMPIGSLGCGPTEEIVRPGMIRGDEITLRAGGQEYVYRSDGRMLVPCSPAAFPGGRSPWPTAASRAAQFRVQDLAVSDLVRRLGIARGDVSVLLVQAVDWPDASLGCPQPGMMYAQVITPGYRISLEANGETFHYHASRQHVVLCPD